MCSSKFMYHETGKDKSLGAESRDGQARHDWPMVSSANVSRFAARCMVADAENHRLEHLFDEITQSERIIQLFSFHEI